MLHQTFLFLGQLWQLFEVSQILEFLRYYPLQTEASNPHSTQTQNMTHSKIHSINYSTPVSYLITPK